MISTFTLLACTQSGSTFDTCFLIIHIFLHVILALVFITDPFLKDYTPSGAIQCQPTKQHNKYFISTHLGIKSQLNKDLINVTGL